MRGPRDALVLGIGNVLWADEGFGVRAVEALWHAYALPAAVEVLDGGTQGLNLLEPVVGRDAVLVFDAIDFGLAPGSLRVLRDRQVPAWAATRMNLHQASFQELLAVAELQGRFPARLTLIGVQPKRLADFGGNLSDCVKARLPMVVALAARELADWGFAPAARTAAAEPLNAAALALAAHASGRPDARLACRVGDARLLNLRARVEAR